MRLKHKIQHYLAITDSELKFLIGLSGIFLLGVSIKFVQQHSVPDYSERYAIIDSLMTAAEERQLASDNTDALSPDSTRASVTSPAAPDMPTAQSRGLINLNTATANDLQSLPGIGPAIAGRIVDYRNRYGRFQRKADLMNVKGIGPRTYEKLSSGITL